MIAKPAGLVTHPTEHRRSGTLVNRLLGAGVPLSAAGGPLRGGIVHRLDAGTSGLMIVASDDRHPRALQAAFRRHAIDRRYLALVRGPTDHDGFTVDAPLGRRGGSVVVRAETGPRRRHGRSRYASDWVGPRCWRRRPGPGGTHQIRVHLRAIGHPILGDARYGGGGDDARALGLARPFLHSWRIGFDHPVTGERIEIGGATAGGPRERARGRRATSDLDGPRRPSVG